MRTKLLFVLLLTSAFTGATSATDNPNTGFQARVQEIEKRIGGRVGVAALDTGTDRRLNYRTEERFAMCSTFKVLAVASVLQRVDEKQEQLERFISYGEADILSYAPITKEHLAEGRMTVAALCDAAIRYSDNTAANLLLETIGGPAGLTAYVRALGDEVTRLDRKEPELNSAIEGDERDTTSPAAMLATLRVLLLGDALTAESRAKLEGWMEGNMTGAALIRAGVPKDWPVGDKTGRSGNGAINDIAILRPRNGPPMLLCIYSTGAKSESSEQEKAIADLAAEVIKQFTR